MKTSLILAPAAFLVGLTLNAPAATGILEPAPPEGSAMQAYYLEIVTRDVDGVVAAYTVALGVQFGESDAGLGGARTAPLAGGGLVGIRAPLRPDEDPVVRPYWLVPDIHASLAAAERVGGQVAHPPLEIPGHGTFAIYVQGGNDHGLWQK
jgi:uncharacterized protein